MPGDRPHGFFFARTVLAAGIAPPGHTTTSREHAAHKWGKYA
ncbi:hypothetical protein PT2222_340039 [Paraburkholderia tropica]